MLGSQPRIPLPSALVLISIVILVSSTMIANPLLSVEAADLEGGNKALITFMDETISADNIRFYKFDILIFNRVKLNAFTGNITIDMTESFTPGEQPAVEFNECDLTSHYPEAMGNIIFIGGTNATVTFSQSHLKNLTVFSSQLTAAESFSFEDGSIDIACVIQGDKKCDVFHRPWIQLPVAKTIRINNNLITLSNGTNGVSAEGENIYSKDDHFVAIGTSPPKAADTVNRTVEIRYNRIGVVNKNWNNVAIFSIEPGDAVGSPTLGAKVYQICDNVVEASNQGVVIGVLGQGSMSFTKPTAILNISNNSFELLSVAESVYGIVLWGDTDIGQTPSPLAFFGSGAYLVVDDNDMALRTNTNTSQLMVGVYWKRRMELNGPQLLAVRRLNFSCAGPSKNCIGVTGVRGEPFFPLNEMVVQNNANVLYQQITIDCAGFTGTACLGVTLGRITISSSSTVKVLDVTVHNGIRGFEVWRPGIKSGSTLEIANVWFNGTDATAVSCTGISVFDFDFQNGGSLHVHDNVLLNTYVGIQEASQYGNKNVLNGPNFWFIERNVITAARYGLFFSVFSGNTGLATSAILRIASNNVTVGRVAGAHGLFFSHLLIVNINYEVNVISNLFQQDREANLNDVRGFAAQMTIGGPVTFTNNSFLGMLQRGLVLHPTVKTGAAIGDGLIRVLNNTIESQYTPIFISSNQKICSMEIHSNVIRAGFDEFSGYACGIDMSTIVETGESLSIINNTIQINNSYQPRGIYLQGRSEIVGLANTNFHIIGNEINFMIVRNYNPARPHHPAIYITTLGYFGSSVWISRNVIRNVDPAGEAAGIFRGFVGIQTDYSTFKSIIVSHNVVEGGFGLRMSRRDYTGVTEVVNNTFNSHFGAFKFYNPRGHIITAWGTPGLHNYINISKNFFNYSVPVSVSGSENCVVDFAVGELIIGSSVPLEPFVIQFNENVIHGGDRSTFCFGRTGSTVRLQQIAPRLEINNNTMVSFGNVTDNKYGLHMDECTVILDATNHSHFSVSSNRVTVHHIVQNNFVQYEGIGAISVQRLFFRGRNARAHLENNHLSMRFLEANNRQLQVGFKVGGLFLYENSSGVVLVNNNIVSIEAPNSSYVSAFFFKVLSVVGDHPGLPGIQGSSFGDEANYAEFAGNVAVVIGGTLGAPSNASFALPMKLVGLNFGTHMNLMSNESLRIHRNHFLVKGPSPRDSSSSELANVAAVAYSGLSLDFNCTGTCANIDNNVLVNATSSSAKMIDLTREAQVGWEVHNHSEFPIVECSNMFLPPPDGTDWSVAASPATFTSIPKTSLQRMTVWDYPAALQNITTTVCPTDTITPTITNITSATESLVLTMSETHSGSLSLSESLSESGGTATPSPSISPSATSSISPTPGTGTSSPSVSASRSDTFSRTKSETTTPSFSKNTPSSTKTISISQGTLSRTSSASLSKATGSFTTSLPLTLTSSLQPTLTQSLSMSAVLSLSATIPPTATTTITESLPFCELPTIAVQPSEIHTIQFVKDGPQLVKVTLDKNGAHVPNTVFNLTWGTMKLHNASFDAKVLFLEITPPADLLPFDGGVVNISIHGTHLICPYVEGENTTTWTSFQLIATPLPIPKPVQQGISGGVVGSGILTGSVGATQVTRMDVLLSLSACEFDLSEELDLMLSPTTFKFGREFLAPSRGAVVANICVVLIFELGILVVSAIGSKLSKRSRLTFHEWLHAFHFPGVGCCLAFILLPGVSSASVTLMFHGDRDDFIIGSFGATYSLALIAGVALLLHPRNFKCVLRNRYHTEEALAEAELAAKSSTWKRITFAPDKWVDDPDDPAAKFFKAKYMHIFFDFREREYIVVELVAVAIIGVLDGFKYRPFCGACVHSMTGLQVITIVFQIYKKPCLTILNNVFVILPAAASLVSAAMLSAAQNAKSQVWLNDVSAYCAVAANIVVTIKLFFDFVAVSAWVNDKGDVMNALKTGGKKSLNTVVSFRELLLPSCCGNKDYECLEDPEQLEGDEEMLLQNDLEKPLLVEDCTSNEKDAACQEGFAKNSLATSQDEEMFPVAVAQVVAPVGKIKMKAADVNYDEILSDILGSTTARGAGADSTSKKFAAGRTTAGNFCDFRHDGVFVLTENEGEGGEAVSTPARTSLAGPTPSKLRIYRTEGQMEMLEEIERMLGEKDVWKGDASPASPKGKNSRMNFEVTPPQQTSVEREAIDLTHLPVHFHTPASMTPAANATPEAVVVELVSDRDAEKDAMDML